MADDPFKLTEFIVLEFDSRNGGGVRACLG